jgi:aspartyl-tRNA(Asn)/glutamyl-tRNA(Gln) amidotransferase subunit C
MTEERKTIKREDVEYLGKLARIRLTEEEIDSFAVEFGKILEYVSSLAVLDTGDAGPARGTGRKDGPVRADRTEKSMDREEILANAPEKTDRFFKVPKII